MKMPSRPVAAIILGCSRSVGLGALILTLAVGAIVAAVSAYDPLVSLCHTVGHTITDLWYGWQQGITHGYTSPRMALFILLGSSLVALWACCISIKLWELPNDDGRTSFVVFGLLTLLAVVVGMVPAMCAITTTLNDVSMDDTLGNLQKGGWVMAAELAVWTLKILCLLAVVRIYVLAVKFQEQNNMV